MPPQHETAAMDPIQLSSCTPITLKFVDLSYTVRMEVPASGRRILCSPAAGEPKSRTILSGITGMVSPGEFVAILGPSGSGKSSLLGILSGRKQLKYTGSVLANEQKLAGPTVRRIGFVAQDDVLYPHLTVRETLAFCALLRLPRTLAKAEKLAVASAVMTELGLDKCGDTIVGNAFVRGVSGGERRRVSIGHEMLVNPSLMILDEPTSGLDSTAAYRVIATLVGLARKGKGVVASVHQPSSRVFQMFDKVLLLSEGRCIYFGNGGEAMTYFAAVGFSPQFPVNPADFMLDLANGIIQERDTTRTNARQDLIASYNKLVAPRIKAMVKAESQHDNIGDEINQEERPGRPDRGVVGWPSQFTILLRRSLKERRHETFNSLRVIQVLATAVLAGTMWWQSDIRHVPDRAGLLFFVSIFWGVLPSFNAVFAFPQERAVVRNERSSGMYTLSPYFMARMAGDLPMELALPLMFTVITYWMAGLRPDVVVFALTMAVLLVYVLVAHGLGLFLGALIMDAKKASLAATITMLAFLLTGGFYVQKVPACLAWTKYMSCTFYCYELLIQLQYSGRAKVLLDGTDVGWHVGAGVSMLALFGMFVGFRLLAYLALRRAKM